VTGKGIVVSLRRCVEKLKVAAPSDQQRGTTTSGLDKSTLTIEGSLAIHRFLSGG
jgi:hypothetical protein